MAGLCRKLHSGVVASPWKNPAGSRVPGPMMLRAHSPNNERFLRRGRHPPTTEAARKIQPEFGTQEEFSTPLQVYGRNELWPTRQLAISAKRKLTCCLCFAYAHFIALDPRPFWKCPQKDSWQNFALLRIGPKWRFLQSLHSLLIGNSWPFSSKFNCCF